VPPYLRAASSSPRPVLCRRSSNPCLRWPRPSHAISLRAAIVGPPLPTPSLAHAAITLHRVGLTRVGANWMSAVWWAHRIERDSSKATIVSFSSISSLLSTQFSKLLKWRRAFGCHSCVECYQMHP
jgi:hypothetical protein